MPTEIIQLLGFDGPNLHGPQPGVFLKLRADKNRAQRVKDALKDGAQGAGMVMGYLEVDSAAEDDSYIISARFTTPTPAIGVELGRYIVEGLNAQEAGDEDWDAEGPLWYLQMLRRAPSHRSYAPMGRCSWATAHAAGLSIRPHSSSPAAGSRRARSASSRPPRLGSAQLPQAESRSFD